MKDPAVLTICCYVKGSLFLLGGVADFIRRNRQLKNWPRAEASVEGLKYNHDGHRLLALIYHSHDGQKHRVLVGGSDTVGLGSVVSVAYDPHNASRAIIIGHGSTTFWSYFMMITGAILVFTGYQFST